MKKIKINDTTIRDIFQNIHPEYIDTKMLDPILNHYNNLNYESLEIWGGASFEKILENKFCKSPWEMLYYVKNKISSIPLQALIGARNLVSFEIYSNNIIERFIKQCIKNGIGIFRVYDCLNDIDNLKFTISVAVENNAKCQGTIIYDDLKNTNFYIETAHKLGQLGCSSICIKDVESTLPPKKAAELFKNLKQKINIPLFFSGYNLRGLQTLNYFQACVSGCDGVDLSFIPSSFNDFSPTVFSFLLSLKDTNISHNLDYLKVLKLYKNIKKYIYPHLNQEPFSSNLIFGSTNKNLLPKWLLSNLYKQLKEIGEIEKIDLIIEEIFKIKNEVGNPSLSTPIGQIIGSQAILNTIISDYRWEIISDEMKKLRWEYYGKLPKKLSKNLTDKLSDSMQPRNNVNRAKVEDIYEQCKSELENLSDSEEDILSYCLFPEKTRKFLKLKKNKKYETPDVYGYNIGPDKKEFELKDKENSLGSKLKHLNIKKIKEISDLVESSNIDEIKLELDGIKISINKSKFKSDKYEYKETEDSGKEKEPELKTERSPNRFIAQENIVEIKSPIVGTFYRTPTPDSPPFVKIGDKVKKGDTLCIIEAMKLMNKIISDYDGVVKEITVKNEEPVEFNQTIMLLKVK